MKKMLQLVAVVVVAIVAAVVGGWRVVAVGGGGAAAAVVADCCLYCHCGCIGQSFTPSQALSSSFLAQRWQPESTAAATTTAAA